LRGLVDGWRSDDPVGLEKELAVHLPKAAGNAGVRAVAETVMGWLKSRPAGASRLLVGEGPHPAFGHRFDPAEDSEELLTSAIAASNLAIDARELLKRAEQAVKRGRQKEAVGLLQEVRLKAYEAWHSLADVGEGYELEGAVELFLLVDDGWRQMSDVWEAMKKVQAGVWCLTLQEVEEKSARFPAPRPKKGARRRPR
jgi:hypothetical protein